MALGRGPSGVFPAPALRPDPGARQLAGGPAGRDRRRQLHAEPGHTANPARGRPLPACPWLGPASSFRPRRPRPVAVHHRRRPVGQPLLATLRGPGPAVARRRAGDSGGRGGPRPDAATGRALTLRRRRRADGPAVAAARSLPAFALSSGPIWSLAIEKAALRAKSDPAGARRSASCGAVRDATGVGDSVRPKGAQR